MTPLGMVDLDDVVVRRRLGVGHHLGVAADRRKPLSLGGQPLAPLGRGAGGEQCVEGLLSSALISGVVK